MPYRIDTDFYVSGLPSVRVVETVGATALVTVCPRTPTPEVQALVPVRYHLPLSDGKRVPVEAATHAADVVLALLAGERTVLLHCVAGRNRSGLVAALVVRQRRNLTGQEAVDWVRDRRPRGLANPAFETWLQHLDRPSSAWVTP